MRFLSREERIGEGPNGGNVGGRQVYLKASLLTVLGENALVRHVDTDAD